ncbi:ankyrin repeat domain-containing protein 63 [Synchiropus splendidus]|uniref:ankyrin repeat domain-containing protein 63 n=1 Tax=Synchiropus splendidus TaxID=270530 RepID=UPI00237D7F48|nr:ankyrin repeat domain-containing protein 63 [Synchiropus splendidus]
MMRPKDLRQGSGTKTFLDAMNGGKVHLARFILDALDGRIINSKTEKSRTPLMHAACLQDPGTRAKFTQLLLEKGAKVNCQDEDGRTALSLACELGHLDAVKILVQFNADPDVTDAWGNSALMYAAYSGHNQVLEFLVRAFKRLGLRMDRTNNNGHSAIEVANFFGHSQCVQILNFPNKRSAGADDPLSGNRLPRHILERFSNEEQLPEVFQRQLKVGDSGRIWNQLTRNPSPEEDHRHSWALPSALEKGKADGNHNFFTGKQQQNSQKDSHQESLPALGKAKSFNLEHLSKRKQSYQGEVHDVSSSKFKRASLQEERCLIDRCQGSSRCRTHDADKPVSQPKPPVTGKSLSTRALEGNVKPQKEEVNDIMRAQQRRGSGAQTGRHHKRLFTRGETEAPGQSPGIVGLGTRLLRRFTAPDFMRMVIDCSSGAGGRGRMARSETFPLSQTNLQVNSQPSVDSISGVRCEFESCSSQFDV